MFTEGLDRNALRWVKEKEVPTGLRSGNDAISGMKSGAGIGFGLPPAAKFRSGHLPSNAIPLSTVMPGETGDRASNSDKDDNLGSEEEVYGGRYSLDFSPQDKRVPDGAARRFGNLNQRRL